MVEGMERRIDAQMSRKDKFSLGVSPNQGRHHSIFICVCLHEKASLIIDDSQNTRREVYYTVQSGVIDGSFVPGLAVAG